MTTLAPKPGFDWNHVSWGKPDSPPTVICSYCSGGLPDVPLMLWKDDGGCAQFCEKCATKWWGVQR
jgi:hypothetical protein